MEMVKEAYLPAQGFFLLAQGFFLPAQGFFLPAQGFFLPAQGLPCSVVLSPGAVLVAGPPPQDVTSPRVTIEAAAIVAKYLIFMAIPSFAVMKVNFYLHCT
ncbi:hypothetical protein [Moorena sp. SIO2C4]|uniref:hypothetical protein n=1 Tax=Moorena sp. SIO2C4 TaxID=2607824 RepID=UPI0013BF7F45|nr:hypothetical protein [Moorena sp. SIO2C4]NEQ14951.1 hypothetical protein [Moorena sp. SIO3E2]NES44146.1 hypothetical protein [Moorena sp. SIO2C4]